MYIYIYVFEKNLYIYIYIYYKNKYIHKIKTQEYIRWQYKYIHKMRTYVYINTYKNNIYIYNENMCMYIYMIRINIRICKYILGDKNTYIIYIYDKTIMYHSPPFFGGGGLELRPKDVRASQKRIATLVRLLTALVQSFLGICKTAFKACLAPVSSKMLDELVNWFGFICTQFCMVLL